MSSLQSIPFRTIEHDNVAMHAFGGFPYLVTWIAPGLHHLLLLPALEEEMLVEAALAQWTANRLPTCLCLDWDRSVFINDDGEPPPADDIPYASLTVSGLIHPRTALGGRADKIESGSGGNVSIGDAPSSFVSRV